MQHSDREEPKDLDVITAQLPPCHVTFNISKMLYNQPNPRNTSNPIMYFVPSPRYPSDVYEAEFLPRDGAMTPGMERYGARSPNRGRESPLRRANTQMYRPVSRSSSRAASRQEIATQTEPRQDYLDHAYGPYSPAPSPRPPLLQRGHTFAGFDSEEMDPFTKQYYNRLWKSRIPSTNVNLNRMGRAGGRWRHIESCVANTGSNLAFIEGTVKQVDNVLVEPLRSINPPSHPRYGPTRPLGGRAPSPKRKAYKDTVFNDHAKNGFRYWYQDQKPIDLASRFRLKARQIGLGY